MTKISKDEMLDLYSKVGRAYFDEKYQHLIDTFLEYYKVYAKDCEDLIDFENAKEDAIEVAIRHNFLKYLSKKK